MVAHSDSGDVLVFDFLWNKCAAHVSIVAAAPGGSGTDNGSNIDDGSEEPTGVGFIFVERDDGWKFKLADRTTGTTWRLDLEEAAATGELRLECIEGGAAALSPIPLQGELDDVQHLFTEFGAAWAIVRAILLLVHTNIDAHGWTRAFVHVGQSVSEADDEPEVIAACLVDAFRGLLSVIGTREDAVGPVDFELSVMISLRDQLTEVMDKAANHYYQTGLAMPLLEIMTEEITRKLPSPSSGTGKGQPIEQDRTGRLPLLVAGPYATIDSFRSLQPKLTAAYTTLEAALRCMLACAMAPIPGDSEEAKVSHLKSAFRSKKPTLGTYVHALKERLSLLQDVLPETQRVLEQEGGNLTPTGSFLFERFVPSRNRLIGHGSPVPESSYVEPLSDSLGALKEVVDAMSVDFSSITQVVPAAVDFTDGSEYKYTLILAEGQERIMRRKLLLNETRLKMGRVYLWHQPDRFTDLDPLIVFGACPVCSVEQVFTLEDLSPRRPIWRSFCDNHRVCRDQGRLVPDHDRGGVTGQR